MSEMSDRAVSRGLRCIDEDIGADLPRLLIPCGICDVIPGGSGFVYSSLVCLLSKERIPLLLPSRHHVHG